MYPVVYYLVRSDLSKKILAHEIASSCNKLHCLLRTHKHHQADLSHSYPRILEVGNEQILHLYKSRMRAHNVPFYMNMYQGRGSVLAAGPSQNPVVRQILNTLKEL